MHWMQMDANIQLMSLICFLVNYYGVWVAVVFSVTLKPAAIPKLSVRLVTILSVFFYNQPYST